MKDYSSANAQKKSFFKDPSTLILANSGRGKTRHFTPRQKSQGRKNIN
jgi:hypothetical protein